MIDKTIKLLPKNLINNIYKDLAQPGIKQVGKALETILSTSNTLLIPLQYINELSNTTFQKNMEKLQKKLSNIPLDKIGYVAPEIGVPLLEKLFYVSNKELSELFINLLKRSAIKEEAHLAHPNFVNVLSSISPDEARIINYYRGNPIHYVSFAIEETTKKENMTYNIIRKLSIYYNEITEHVDLIFPNNFHIYNTNMFCLGITDSMGIISKTKEHEEILSLYKNEISKQKKDLELQYKDDKSKKIILQYGQIKFTEFGNLFIKACCS